MKDVHWKLSPLNHNFTLHCPSADGAPYRVRRTRGKGPPKEKVPMKQAPKEQEEEKEEENSQDSKFNPDKLPDTADILEKLHKNRWMKEMDLYISYICCFS